MLRIMSGRGIIQTWSEIRKGYLPKPWLNDCRSPDGMVNTGRSGPTGHRRQFDVYSTLVQCNFVEMTWKHVDSSSVCPVGNYFPGCLSELTEQYKYSFPLWRRNTVKYPLFVYNVIVLSNCCKFTGHVFFPL
jgi:hypothetical protein